ncbi:MAG: LamG domain-containing protein [Candidatus Pacebacteria bacterium]|nr:LamG domain-containing protein [Candidatus Paceibacterota bacterium]
MTNRRTPMTSLMAVFLGGLIAASSHATMLYYMPFDDGTNATLANYGSLGGTATAVYGYTTPSDSTNARMGSHSEYCPVWSVNNQQGGHVSLPSSTDQLRLDSIGDTITVTAWVNSQDITGYWAQGIVSTLDYTTDGWVFGIERGSRKLRFRSESSNTTDSTSGGLSVPADTWAHVAMRWEAGTHRPRFFVNGVAGSGTYSGDAPAYTNTNDIRVGIWNDGKNGPINGYLDDVAVWDEGLSDAQVIGIYNLAVDAGMDVGMANSMLGVYDGAGADDGFVNGTGWYAWYDGVDRGLGTAGSVTYLGFMDSIYGYDYGRAGNAHYYYLNLGSGVVFAIPEPASLTLLGMGVLGLLRRRGRHA